MAADGAAIGGAVPLTTDDVTRIKYELKTALDRRGVLDALKARLRR
jgi:hypothetical protein